MSDDHDYRADAERLGRMLDNKRKNRLGLSAPGVILPFPNKAMRGFKGNLAAHAIDDAIATENARAAESTFDGGDAA